MNRQTALTNINNLTRILCVIFPFKNNIVHSRKRIAIGTAINTRSTNVSFGIPSLSPSRVASQRPNSTPVPIIIPYQYTGNGPSWIATRSSCGTKLTATYVYDLPLQSLLLISLTQLHSLIVQRTAVSH